MGNLDKITEAFFDGFKPAAERADKNIKEKKKKYGSQLEEDLKETPMQRALKVKKGFFGQKG